MTAERHDLPYRHPWLATFAAAPEVELAEFLAGHAPIHPYGRADAPDAARMLFKHLPANDPVLRVLDGAMLGWLDARRRMPIPIAPAKLQRFVREVAEDFEIVAILDLAQTAAVLRRRFVLWNEWASRLVLSPARDARTAYWQMLALTQPPLATRHDPAAAMPVGLGPLWLRICREAGNVLPRYCLDIGLLGQMIDDLAFPFISPLGTDDDSICHDALLAEIGCTLIRLLIWH